MYIDTHAHLNFEEFKEDYPAVIERAHQAGVKKIIVPSSDPENGRRAVEIAQRFQGVYPAVGAHPLFIKSGFSLEVDDGLPPALLFESYNGSYSRRCSLDHLKEMVAYPEVKAIGEIGLDYYGREGGGVVDREVQKAALVAIIKITLTVGKPFIFHCRPSGGSTDALQDLYQILTGFFSSSSQLRGVVHCFVGDHRWAEKLFQIGFLVSYTGLITFNNHYNRYIDQIPLDRLLIETDAPFLAPPPHRGERCEPAYVVEVARKIAQIKKVSLKKVATETTKRAEELFGI
jgi:TatD DNase family protein